jgi:hypothetical protein
VFQSQAEFATWIPEKEDCRGARGEDSLTPYEMCRVLQDASLTFIGDSFVRHVYTALLLAITGNERSGALLMYAPPGEKSLLFIIFIVIVVVFVVIMAGRIA